ncbi:MAG: hypothetical protein ACREOM_01970 [Candidatus Dormibacteraceae bacterium]
MSTEFKKVERCLRDGDQLLARELIDVEVTDLVGAVDQPSGFQLHDGRNKRHAFPCIPKGAIGDPGIDGITVDAEGDVWVITESPSRTDPHQPCLEGGRTRTFGAQPAPKPPDIQ